MQAKKRLPEVSVIQHLMDQPQQFQFVQAMRILVRWLRQTGLCCDDEQALSHVLRFQNSLSLSFPASPIEALRTEPARYETDIELLQAMRKVPGAKILLTPAFLGLFGLNAGMPLHRTERMVAAQRWKGDDSARAFIDLLSQRMMAMFFQAWGKYRLEHQFDMGGKDGQLPLLTALAGIHHGALPDGTDDAAYEMAGFHAVLLRTRPVAASSVSRVLTHHFGVPVELEPFVEAWDLIPKNKRSKLGAGVAKLGYGAVLGGRLRRRDLRVRLNIGPLDKADAERFLPRGSAAVALAQRVKMFALPNLQFEVRILFKPPCLQRLILTSEPGAGRRLNWDAFLLRQDGNVSRNTAGYLLRFKEAA
ncbi:type VI secretion system baseplate subunit TssG [Janthinobacterium sp. SUN118]|uniref:type VI secretion system baseplate subunit TssG n=1 Tax=Janthinobacterium sp. SUN118 TaxID=3004100 RepID=UPI0025AFA75B|nr:type VI secretion system baseplate subunit TssG [Janthinobacterium sp. SUN118]MDN2711621.1 type VI secretion system baseplate subunit TssG [Janthinobacterium sp. SUN118]